MSFTQSANQFRGLRNVVLQAFRNALKRNDKVATGETLKSLKARVFIGFSKFELDILGSKAFFFIQSGRKPGGKMPPVDALVKWIKARKIQGRSKRGRFLSDRALAFAIGRGIVKHGIKPTDIFGDVEREITDPISKAINESAKKDIVTSIKRA